MIKPTPGRIVWFWPYGKAQYEAYVNRGDDSAQPRAAIIAHVWNDRSVNLVSFTSGPDIEPITHAHLVQPEDEIPDDWAFASWMPYQIGQAAKALAEDESRKADKDPTPTPTPIAES